MSTWPSTLPQTPLLDGYSEQLRDSRLISKPDAGYNKIRNRFTAVPIDVTESWLFTPQEYAEFNDFYQSTLGYGSEEFIKKHPTTGVDRRYRFVNVPKSAQQGLHVKVSMTLEIMPEVTVL